MVSQKIKEIILNFFAYMEISIGGFTLLSVSAAQFYRIWDFPAKPDNVYLFVVASSSCAIILGFCLLLRKDWARLLLIFFSGYIILTKLLAYSGLLVLRTPLLNFMEPWVIGVLSISYHTALILFLALPKNK